jgi:hypothetical protein
MFIVTAAALLLSTFSVEAYTDEFQGTQSVNMVVRAQDVRSRASVGTVDHVNFAVAVRIGDPRPVVAFHHYGAFAWADDGDVYLLVDGKRLHVECRRSDDRKSIYCFDNVQRILAPLRAAKTSARIRTDLAEFALSIDDLQSAFARLETLVAQLSKK